MRSPITLALATVMLAGCASGPRPIVVGSKNFTENVFLGELIAQELEQRGFAVDRRLNLGGTFLCHEALRAGEIDVYPEYTGTALLAILEQPALRDSQAALEAVRRSYLDADQLRWTEPFGFNNTYAILVRGDEPPELRSISDLAKRSQQFVIGFGFEFVERDDGLDGLVEAYGLQFAGEPRTMDLSIVYQALRDGKIDVGVGNSTHGLVEAFDLRILADDRRYFPPYDAAPVVRQQTLDAHPGLREAFDALGGSISQTTMQAVNRELDVEQRRVEDVVSEVREAR